MEAASVFGGKLSRMRLAREENVSFGSTVSLNWPFGDSNLSSICEMDVVVQDKEIRIVNVLDGPSPKVGRW